MSKNTDKVKADYNGYSKYSENYQRDLLTAQEKDAAANANRAPRERDPEIDAKFENCISSLASCCIGDSDSDDSGEGGHCCCCTIF